MCCEVWPWRTRRLICLVAVGGREYRDVDAPRLQIRHPSTLKDIFTSIVGVVDEAQQVRKKQVVC